MNAKPRQLMGSSTGRLTARPSDPASTGSLGLRALGLGAGCDGLLYVPASYRPGQPAPLALALHGAGGTAGGALSPLLPLANEAGLILVAPESRRRTWDLLVGGYGPDVAFISRALDGVFERYWVAPTHLAIEGFSDGASYALSLGLTNGDLFTHVLAFAPGFQAPAAQVGRPGLFIAHGLHDAVLPIDQCSRRIVPALRGAGYEVTYHEFDGPHTVPPEIALEGLAWFMGPAELPTNSA